MAPIWQLEGRQWLVDSKGSAEYVKEPGVGMALQKTGAMPKPDCSMSYDTKNLTMKTESTLRTTQFSCTLGEKVEETTADGRKTQTVCIRSTSGTGWEGKHNKKKTERKLEEGILAVDCVINKVTCTWVYEKVE
uniref:Uncharacterized protein n=1 Tax=Prolemur simus TaxID=1328070 RepID=A0A8C8ZWF5_PROSS